MHEAQMPADVVQRLGLPEESLNGSGPKEKEERRNQADRLIGYALEDASALFVDQHGAPHALVDGEPLPLNSRCYSWLRRRMWEQEQRAVNGEYLKTAAGTLAAHAEFSDDVRELHTRAAWQTSLMSELMSGDTPLTMRVLTLLITLTLEMESLGQTTP